MTSTPLPGKTETKEENKDKPKDEPSQEEPEEDAILENQLRLAVDVLTSKSCSEEGLEDATNLLLQLSRANNATRETVLLLLLSGSHQLGVVVQQHIRYKFDYSFLPELIFHGITTGSNYNELVIALISLRYFLVGCCCFLVTPAKTPLKTHSHASLQTAHIVSLFHPIELWSIGLICKL